jgi:hypothetical protein
MSPPSPRPFDPRPSWHAAPTSGPGGPARATPDEGSAEQRFTNLRYWKDLDSGGHFPALEKPSVLADELRAFFSLLN